jgi:hypothetical protein
MIYKQSDYLFHAIYKPSDFYFRCPLRPKRRWPGGRAAETATGAAPPETGKSGI